MVANPRGAKSSSPRATRDQTRSKTVLFVGHYMEDTRSLCRVATALARTSQLEPVFWIYVPGHTTAEALVAAQGFPLLSVARSEQTSTENPTLNPMRRVRTLLGANRAVSWGVLEQTRPVAVVCTGNPVRYSFLRIAHEQGIPSLHLQWTEAFSPEWYRAWFRAREKAKDAKLPPLRWIRRKIARRLYEFLGEGTRWPVPRRFATRFAVPGEFYREMYLRAGVAPEKIRVTGNPQCDEMHRCSVLTPEDLAALRRRLGVTPERPFLFFALDDFEQNTHFDRQMAEEADAKILRAMREALPDYPRVVKLHPKQSAEHAARIRSVDPEAIVVGNEYEIGGLIAAAAVVVCITSSSLLWAMGIDRPAISAFFWRDAEEMKMVRHYSGVEQADSFEALAAALRRNVLDPDHIAAWRERRARCREQMLRVDGESVDRLVAEISSLITENGNDGA